MKKTNGVKKITALLLASAMLFMASCVKEPAEEEVPSGTGGNASIEHYGETTENVTKSETVYVNLNSSGAPQKITVSDWLHADRDRVSVKDTTTLTDITVTKGQAAGEISNGNITWQMNSSDVYYEGASNKALPVDISIKYFLDGIETAPENLPGKSGDFRMEVTMKNNISKEVTVNGRTVTMYTPLVVVGGMILPYEKFSDIEVSNGLSIGGGSYEVAVLAGAPGLNESLNLSGLNISGFEDFSFPDTFTVSAKVTDFSMGDTYYMIIPLSSLNLNIDMPKTLEDVQNILDEVGDLQDLLGRIDPNQVLTKFLTDGSSLKEMMNILQQAVTIYDENEKLLKVMTEHLTPQNIETLTSFVNSLDANQLNSVMSLLSNIPALQVALGSVINITDDLDKVMPILDELSAAFKDPEVAAALEKLPQTLETLNNLMNYLNENQEMLNILTNLMSSDDMGRLTGILDSIIEGGNISIGDTDVSQLTGEAKEIILRMEEWLKFDYGIYTSAPDYMKTSCMFICKTDPIS